MPELLQLFCGGECGAYDRVPAYVGKDQQLRPVQAHAYVCLDCWRAGWRSDGMKAFKLVSSDG